MNVVHYSRGMSISSSFGILTMNRLIISIISLVAAVSAQQSPYGQCGGSSYAGPTSCTAGYTCSSYNPYYYQCIPGKEYPHRFDKRL